MLSFTVNPIYDKSYCTYALHNVVASHYQKLITNSFIML